MRSRTAFLGAACGWLLLVSSTIVAAACGGSSSGGVASCGDAGICPAGMVCGASGVCVPEGDGGSSGAGGGAGISGAGSGGIAGSGGVAGSGGIAGGGGLAGTGGVSGAAGAQPTVFGFRKLFLGDTDRQGNPDTSAWKTYGQNLDGLISTPQSTNHCQPVMGASKSTVQNDGVDGIDNSFGANLTPILAALAANPSDTITQQIQAGAWTMILRLSMLSSASDQTGIVTGLFTGAPRGVPPVWNGTDVWPVTAESVVGADVNQPKVVFPASSVAAGTWMSGAAATISLSLGLGGFDMLLTIDKATISMDVFGTGPSAYATMGTIAGVIQTEQLIAELKKVAGAIDPSLCYASTFDAIAQQIRQASDIMSDGTNGDPTKTCNAISVGLGFDASAIVLGSVASPVPPAPDPCAGG